MNGQSAPVLRAALERIAGIRVEHPGIPFVPNASLDAIITKISELLITIESDGAEVEQLLAKHQVELASYLSHYLGEHPACASRIEIARWDIAMQLAGRNLDRQKTR